MERGVIFVDLSLAQIASLGATLALLVPAFGGDPHSPSVYWMSLGFTFIGAAIFSLIKGHKARAAGGDHRHFRGRLRGRHRGHEPVHRRERAPEGHAGGQHPVGLVERSLEDRRHLPGDRVFHFIFRERFLLISLNPQAAEAAAGVSVRFWDFLFYASFGVVVTRSVAIAGVLLVFCYLIVPSVAGMLYSDKVGARLTIGWIMGVDHIHARDVFFSRVGSADRRHHRLHVWRGADSDGCGPAAASRETRYSVARESNSSHRAYVAVSAARCCSSCSRAAWMASAPLR